METRKATLCFVREGDKILLGMKKRGFGAGRWNGFGGKVNPGENILEAAKRELQEESGLVADEMNLVGVISFEYDYQDYLTEVSVFDIKSYAGVLSESEEMRPEWFALGNIPYKEMWPDDLIWLPEFLNGKKITASFVYDKDDKIVQQKVITT